ncbi:beta strand repeat-containing protein, partial [Olleya namhaensis]|uniref:beta strand repeat-containing protein n=1 Tax=Olleya namhaensis TaxID=1144750 RepID=UPI00232FC07B
MNKLHRLLFIVFLLIGFSAKAQVKKAFTPRYNSTITGDITMVANNVLSRTATTDYNLEQDNHDFTDNVYVDIDSDTSTFNSSSANLVNPRPNDPCLEIDKVLLYWAAADKGVDVSGVETDNQPNWNYNNVKLMLPGQTTYTTIIADDIIYRGRNENPHLNNDPYVCVKDITSTVKNLAVPFGKYQVANVEAKTGFLISHGNTNTGTSGGWQVIMVYKSDKLKTRNITLFDGYANVTSSQNNFDINFSGFQTVPIGKVQSDIVIGALEGDRSLTGDRLQILNAANTFEDIVAPLRSANNFFNSRITVGPSNGANNFTDRNPASLNTLGFDAAVFPLANKGNSVLINNQTSATFRLTSNQETYGLFVLGFSVEVYQPSLEPIFTATPSTVTPSDTPQTVTYSATITNTGNDNANNVVLSTVIPLGSELVLPITGLTSGVTYTYDNSTRTLVFTVPDGVLLAGESLTVAYNSTINVSCYYLENQCSDVLNSVLTATYNGELNIKGFSNNSSNDIDSCGIGNTLATPVIVNSPPPATWVTLPEALDKNISCNDSNALSNAQSLVPVSSCSGLTLVKTSGDFVASSDCPSNGTYTNTWNFTDSCGRTIANYIQTITVTDNTPPTFTAPTNTEIFTDASCKYNASVAITGDVTDEADNCSTGLNATFTDSVANGTCDGTFIITRTWSLVDDCGNNAPTQTQTITVSDNLAPSFSAPADIEIFTDASCNYDASTTKTGDVTNESDNCSTGLNATFTDSIADGTCNGDFVITRTWSLVDDCGNEAQTQTQTITVSDNLAPSFTAPADIEIFTDASCNYDASAIITGDVTNESDNCATGLNATFTDAVAPGACPGTFIITRTWALADDCGNEAQTQTQTITVSDNIPPTFIQTLPTNGTVDYDAIPTAPTLTATDNCGDADVTFSETTTGDICTGTITITRTWTATDECNLTTEHIQTLTVTQPVLGATIATVTNVLCNSEATGSIDITVTGGTAPYTYVWNDVSNSTSQDLSNVLAGAYNVTITDDNGCTTSVGATISEPSSPLSLNITKVDATTAQGCANGQATAIVSGGTANYTYLWSASAGSATTASVTGLSDGTHSVTVSDANNCTITQSIVIECVNTCDAEIAITNVTDVLCTGDTTGTGTVTANSDANPSATFTFVWNDGNSDVQTDTAVTSSTLANLSAGVYSVSVTIDGTVCQAVAKTIAITEPSNALNVTATTTDESGPTTGDGTATAIVTGGVAPYTYSWTPNGETTDALTGLSAAEYCVTVTDANGCTDTTCVTVNPGSCNNLSVTGSSNPAICFGESNGSITATVTGGSGNFSYSWDTISNTTTSVNNLPAGDYTITVTDNVTLCTTNTTITINEPNVLSSAIAVTNILCKDDTTGSLDLAVNGGNGGYTFLWNDTNASTTEDLINVVAGTYTVTITDSKGCETTQSATILEPATSVSATITTQTDIVCEGLGTIIIEGAGGIAPYSYSIDGGANYQTDGTFANLPEANYTITIVDANGCTTTVTTEILINCTDAIADINNTFQDQPVTGNVLTNDEDFEGDNQTVTANTNPANGTVTIDAAGNYTYTPNAGFTGEDTFTYTICDDGNPQACDTATVYIEVLPVSG